MPASPANSKSVKIALPEVKVGIFPGAGGTQRVPRLINTQDALQIMTTGQSLTAARAKASACSTEVVEPANLIPAAKELIKKGVDPVAPWDKKGFKAPGGTHLVAAGRAAQFSAGQCHPAPRDQHELSRRACDPQMRL